MDILQYICLNSAIDLIEISKVNIDALTMRERMRKIASTLIDAANAGGD